MTARRPASHLQRSRRTACAILALLAWALGCAPAHGYDRDKSDVVVLRNGNYLTGDILALEYGTLTLKTDQMSTLRIEWPAVRSISSKFAFAVERIGGAKYYGVITTDNAADTLVVTTDTGVVRVRMDELERLSRYSLSFWNRISGNLAVGFTYTKANDTTVGSMNFDANYRSTAVESSLAFNSNTTKTEDGGDSYRGLLSSSVMFLRQSRNFWGLVGSLERDQELGINARLVAGAVVGRRFLESSYMEVTGSAGVVGAQESITSNPQQQTSAEGVLSAEWRVFKFSDPETSLTLGVSLFPSLTENDRYRGNGNLNLTHKIAGDFTLGLTGYWSADSHPPDPTAHKSDYGLTFNIGYSFGQ